MSSRSDRRTAPSEDTTENLTDTKPLENTDTLENEPELEKSDARTGADTEAEPAGPTCPRCGTRLVATTTTGPTTHYGSPCGCRLRSTDLEFE
ncbi:hypothetical protein [Natronoglomus mannanivorans]|uniref:Uncharacterized protein n=1 Tax=Natronoglomus mannanivorans TaxID=2979990 RepID=A0AAP2YV76_9EURY|nr:hypothetical protein [Halobacteria archaeon AArc-xg1-1]